MSERDLALREFLAESREGLGLVEAELLGLERGGADRARVDAAFRALHTIKGTAGFLGLRAVEALAHEGEELLSLAREAGRALPPEQVSALLSLVDALRRVLSALEAGGHEPELDLAPLLARARRAREDGAPAERAAPAPAPAGALAAAESADPTIRLDVRAADRLMNLVGELVLVRNQALQLAGGDHAAAVVAMSQRLDQVTAELQDEVMRTRLQRIGGLWGALRRVARDVAAAQGKLVRVETEGAETELDRAIVEAIRAPLTHLVRNAVDHGVEGPDARAARGKEREGAIHLRARHEGGKVVVDVADDGAGVDARRLAERAVQGGHATAEQVARLGERELLALAFRPGLSTARAVTALSGRGVGLDVVKTAVERIGGAVELESEPGRGTTVRLRIPLTLAIVPAVLVSSGGQRFAVPQAHVVEVVRVEASAAIERVLSVPVFRLRGRLLSLLHLEAELRDGPPAAPADERAIVVLQADGRQVGLLVADVHDTEEIVVKPLGRLLKGHRLFSGATVLGDGEVALILDVAGLVARSHARAEAPAAQPPRGAPQARPTTYLLVDVAAERAAVPLDAVARLEELPRASLERALGREVVQYRGEVVPLVRLARGPAADAGDTVPVVMVAGPTGTAALVVDRIIDVLEHPPGPPSPAPVARRGVLGTAVIAQRVTQVLDIRDLVAAALEGAEGEG